MLNYVFNIALMQGDVQLGSGPANVIAENMDNAIEKLRPEIAKNFPDNGQHDRHLMVFTLVAITVPRTTWEAMQIAVKTASPIIAANG